MPITSPLDTRFDRRERRRERLTSGRLYPRSPLSSPVLVHRSPAAQLPRRTQGMLLQNGSRLAGTLLPMSSCQHPFHHSIIPSFHSRQQLAVLPRSGCKKSPPRSFAAQPRGGLVLRLRRFAAPSLLAPAGLRTAGGLSSACKFVGLWLQIRVRLATTCIRLRVSGYVWRLRVGHRVSCANNHFTAHLTDRLHRHP